ncbi:hypothetical protein ISS05_04100 [Candidatus Woesearchaeota archaeon]|nr:hypothetical protein [Candidatus Woesearchaeota archaeon]
MFNINIIEIREELENLKEIKEVIDNFQKYSELHDKKFLKTVYQQSIPVEITLMNSHLKEKNELNERLRSLFYNLSVLRSSILTKDKEKTLKVINNFLKNDYSGIPAITNELNELKSKIKNLDDHYKLLMDYVPKNLEHKLTTEAKCKEHIDRLHSIHKKQKDIFMDISRWFVKLSRTGLKTIR